MKVKSLTPVIATHKLKESKEFYTRHFGFKPIYENDWYVQLRADGDTAIDVAFVLPNHETQPPVFKPAFCGSGAIYTIEVGDATAEFERLRKAGVPIAYGLHDEPWGERHFAIIDPNGVPVNISQPIEPGPEYISFFK